MKHIVRAADRTAANEESGGHPFNPKSELHGHHLSRPTGLKRIGLWQARVPPGKESFIYHRHYREEEFMYVLAGHAIVEIDDAEHEVGPGDFIGFPTGTAHHIRNPFEEDFVYLSGGERLDAEIADFPRLGKRMVRLGERTDIYPLDAAEGFPGMEKI